MRSVGIVVALAVLTGGCGRAPKAETPALPQVRIAQVGGQPVEATVFATGSIALRRETSLGFTSAGRIAAIRVDDGDVVRGGQVLAALDTTTVAADLSSARAERERAAAEYTRSARLFEQGWVTRPRVESAKASLAAADARVRATGFQTSNAVIVAPGPGRILSRVAEPGQVVAAGTPVLVLGEASSGYVLRLPVADRDAARLRVGAPAQVSLEGATVTGSVSEIAGRADRQTGTFAVEIALPPSDALRSGQIATARIVAAGGGGTELAVPPAALFAARAGQGFVYVYDDATKRVRLRRVTIADTGDTSIRVTGGLKPGEWIATSRIDRLADNMAVAPLRPTR